MKIVLISPPREKLQIPDFPPLGLAWLGAVAVRMGHKVKIIDAANWGWEKLAEAVRYESPDVVGITCLTIERGQAFETIRVARRVAPRATIVVGGQHATAFPHHIFLKTPADFVVLGEGEATFAELLEALSNNCDVSGISGLAYRKGDQCVLTPKRSFEKNLDTLSLPLHDQFEYSLYNGMADTQRRAAAVITSRGCPFNCVFCSSAVFWGKMYRTRSVDNIIKEVDLLYHQYGIRAILFFDDNLTIDKKRCIALSNALYDRKLDLIWAAEGSVKVDRELLEAMRRGGCYRIDFGVESGSPKVLKNINKAFSVDDTRKAFRLCKDAGIKPNAYLMFGAPGETPQTIHETVQLMKDIQPEALSFSRAGLWILPNTRLHEMSVQQGLVSEERWLSDDSAFVYTAEHNQAALNKLALLYYRAMFRNLLLRSFVDVQRWKKLWRLVMIGPWSFVTSLWRHMLTYLNGA